MFIRNNENGILIDMGDEEALVEAMTKVAEDQVFAKELACNAVQIRDDLTVDKIVKKWIE